jgi:glycosyltransferase involved in cell wall biosynthesis
VGLRQRLRGSMQALLVATEAAISRRAARIVPGATHVVASYGTALDAFRAAGPGTVKVLNYPIAHHQYQFDCYAEERALNPAFAGMLPTFDWPPGYQERLEAEIALADRILVGSRFVRDSFTAQGIAIERLCVEPYGVDTSRFGPPPAGRSHDTFRALYVGQIGQRKGISYLLEAWRRFRGPDTELLLVGGAVGDPAPLRAYEGIYRYRPSVPQVELPGIYHSADVFVFPTLIEGMPLVVVEAMACGLPVICTDRGPDDLVRDGVEGFIVPIRSPEAIAEKLTLLRGDPALRERMSRAALARAAEFNWARYCAGALASVIGEVPA